MTSLGMKAMSNMNHNPYGQQNSQFRTKKKY